MPIRTLADISSEGNDGEISSYGNNSPSVRPAAIAASNNNNNSSSSSNTSTASVPPPFPCCEIPTLPQSEQAKAMLLRVVGEFQPIITRRNYNVRSISELCCCGDGLDHHYRNRRKRNRMANSIWGYNQTTTTTRGRKQTSHHTIHLRLRHPTDHTRFLVYEDVAGTLAHELAHCEHIPHNKAFYTLMDTILEEHAALMAAGFVQASGAAAVTQQQQLPFDGNGVRLGGGNSSRGQRLGGTGRPVSRLLVQQQQQGGTALGGDAVFTTWMSPAQAAAAAAEARQRLRLRGDRCCRPCVILDDEDEQQPSSSSLSKRSRMIENRENTAAPDTNVATASTICIDLTTSDDEEDTKPAASAEKWACHACTFRNNSMALACSMCSTERKRE